MRRLTQQATRLAARRLRRLHETGSDTGGVALLVAILLGGGVLLGMAALTVDVGQLYAERRQVQNSADAASLALANDCARGATCDVSLAGAGRTVADLNSNDAATRVTTVCGAGVAGLTVCPAQSGPVLGQCPAVPTGTAKWIRVRTATLRADGSTLLPPSFAQTLAGNSGYAGTSVGACAQAAWGTPSGLGALPVTLSKCEWDAATAGGTAFVAPPPYPPYPPAAKESKLVLHSTDDTGGCPSGYSGGAYADLPGGFGWLDGDASCNVTTTVGGTVKADTGVSGSTCGDVVATNVGKVLYLPVYSAADKPGKKYTIAGYAAFYVTGYNLPGVHPNKVASPLHGHWCTGSDKCIYGFFTKGLVPTSGSLGTGPGMGASVIALIG